MKHISMFARRAAALLLAAVLLVGAIPAAFAEEEGTPEGEAVTETVYTVPTTIGGARSARWRWRCPRTSGPKRPVKAAPRWACPRSRR